MKDKTILVTGGQGLIGTHLIRTLSKNPNHNIISLDAQVLDYDYSKDMIDGVQYIVGHTKNISELVTLRPDLVYHLGEYSRVEQSFEDIERVWDQNVCGTFNVLEFCRQNKSKLVYAGSSTKFADGGMGRNQSPYAWMKASNTELVQNYGNWFDLDYAITYFYNVFGERELSVGPYASVIGAFKELYRRGEPIRVVSPGTQKRNFTHVSDIVRGLIHIGESGQGDEYGLGNTNSVSILDLAKMFGTKIEMIPERQGNRMDSRADLTRAQKEFGWKAEVRLEDYIKEIIKND